ncbi:MAG: hypothetical protein ABII22_01665 [Candidatus Micrarchaeota archaeon]
MADELVETIVSKNRKKIILANLEKGMRLDGRTPEQFRNIEIKRGVMPHADGSALVELGKTKVLAANKITIDKPFSDRPEEGIMMYGAEFVPMAHPNFESGPPNEDSIELARVVDRGIRSAECIDTKSFFIEKDKVLALFGDLWVLDHCGNLIDCASIAAISALIDTKIPKIENGVLNRDKIDRELNPKALPVSTTFVKIANYWLVDPDIEEESCADTCICISTTEEHVCSIQKREGSLSKQELSDLIELAFKTGNDIRRFLY